jgi:Ca2+-binding EF-hand superfamily protein
MSFKADQLMDLDSFRSLLRVRAKAADIEAELVAALQVFSKHHTGRPLVDTIQQILSSIRRPRIRSQARQATP